MNCNEIFQLVYNLSVGTKLRLTYLQLRKQDEIQLAMAYLLGMKNGGSINMTDTTLLIVYAIMHSGKWGVDSDRVIDVTTTAEFNPESFADRTDRMIEKLEIV